MSESSEESLKELHKRYDSIVDTVSSIKKYREDYNKEQRLLWLLNALHGDVWYGGFQQYFSSSFGTTANAAADALQSLGAEKCLSALNKALTIFPESRVFDDFEQQEQFLEQHLDAKLGFLEECSDEFEHGRADLLRRLIKFIETNKSVLEKT